MPYLVFARKWRPKDFDDVVGQDHVIQSLKNALRSDKVAQAYLFSGSQGVGKTSCARILAKGLNCQSGPTEKPCGVCSACVEIAEGRSLDVLEIDGASNRGIDEIRTLRENVKFAPLNGRYKVYIIDEVHMLTSEAFNALLKTLEEPPPFVKFIFATTQPDKVLATILSRCQRFDFVRLTSAKIVAKLQEISRAEGVTVKDEVLFAIARAAEGSLRDAESILDQMLSFSSKEVTLKDVVAVLGIIENEAFFNFAGAVIARDPAAALRVIAAVVGQGKDINYFLEGLLDYYRNLMVLKVVASEPSTLIDLPGDEIQKLAKHAEAMTLGDILATIHLIFSAGEMAKKLNNARTPLEFLAVRLCSGISRRQESSLQPSVVKAAPPATPLSVPAPVATVAKKTFVVLKEEKGSIETGFSSAPKASSCSLEEVKDRWEALITHVSGIKMSLATYLKEATPVRLETGVLTLGFPNNAVFFKEALAHKDNMSILEKAVASVIGSPLRLNLETVEALGEKKKEAAALPESPFLKSALDLFQGKIIKKT
jgi:DNA polymerase-3 subunit gamma/tau